MWRGIFVAVLAVAVIAIQPGQAADPVGDFFKRLANSISNAGRKTPPPRNGKKTSGKSTSHKPGLTSPTPAPGGNIAVVEEPTAPPAAVQPTAPPLVVRAATNAPPSRTRRDVPYGVPVPKRPGFVTSPYAPSAGLVDVRGFPSGSEVTDPYTGKVFLTP